MTLGSVEDIVDWTSDENSIESFGIRRALLAIAALALGAVNPGAARAEVA
jgi:hypothetical protein